MLTPKLYPHSPPAFLGELMRAFLYLQKITRRDIIEYQNCISFILIYLFSCDFLTRYLVSLKNIIKEQTSLLPQNRRLIHQISQNLDLIHEKIF